MRQGAELRSKVEAAIGRYKRVIGDALRSREDARRVCEVKIAVKASRARSNKATLMLHKTREQHAPPSQGRKASVSAAEKPLRKAHAGAHRPLHPNPAHKRDPQ